jgi:hypothetical protein
METQHQLTDLFEKLGLAGLSPEQKEKYLQEWTDMVQQKVTLRVMNELSEEDQKKLEKLSGKAFEEFLQKNIPNFNAIMVEETVRFREDLIADANYLRGKFNA